MNSKGIITLSLSSLLTVTPASVLAQEFNKFKSKTRYNQGQKGAATKLLDKAVKVEPSVPDSNSQAKKTRPDIFGRGTGIADSKAGVKDPKYVLLNPETAFGPELVESFDFQNASLVELTKYMQDLTGINLILDKELKGKISIMAPTPITVGDAWKAFLTALNINGYTLVRSGAFYKIVNSRDVRYTPTKIYTGNYTPDTENYVMRVIPLKNINSTEVTRSFRPYMSRYGRIIDIKQTNTVIVQDTGSNINRLMRLIKFIDVPGHEESLQIMTVKYSSAQEIAKLLDQILKSGGSTGKFRASGGGKSGQNISKIIAEPRTNTIIAMANASGAKQLRKLIQQLDVKSVATNGGKIHVYYLNHGDAETLSKTLSSLVSSTSKGATGTRFSKTAPTSTGLFSAEVKITSDKENNAIVVTASPTDYLTIKDVIGKLDIARDQVYVEGLMMETQVSKAKAFGISVIGAYGSGNAQRAGFTQGSDDGLFGLLNNQITSLGGLFAGIGIGKSIDFDPGTGSTIKINTINGLITAIASHGLTNVLATPQILALDNVEATFESGESIPTPERTNAANGSSTVALKPQKVGLTLKITPQINKVTRFVKLKIDQKIQDFSQRALPDGIKKDGVATVERSAQTTVVVRDRDTIAMGGLMRDKEISSVSKVPLLGDIPILGWLFKNKKSTIEKVNLLFFLTPRILANYQKEVSHKVRDVLNRRNIHLKDAIGERDAFGSTAKGLYDKAKKQGEGPLYDVEEASRYKRQNEGPGIGNREDDQSMYEIPNYKEIEQEVQSLRSGIQKK